jgi:hypothetical protein
MVHHSLTARTSQQPSADGAFDRTSSTSELWNLVSAFHGTTCCCNDQTNCIQLLRRCQIQRKTLHSLAYMKRGSSVSYFVEYHDDQRRNLFGAVRIFFKCCDRSYCIIEKHSNRGLFSDRFASSPYHSLLRKTLDVFFHSLSLQPSSVAIVGVTNVIDMCLVFEDNQSLIATPLSSSYEHD